MDTYLTTLLAALQRLRVTHTPQVWAHSWGAAWWQRPESSRFCDLSLSPSGPQPCHQSRPGLRVLPACRPASSAPRAAQEEGPTAESELTLEMHVPRRSTSGHLPGGQLETRTDPC